MAREVLFKLEFRDVLIFFNISQNSLFQNFGTGKFGIISKAGSK
jgi:hypothetical protein